MKVLHTSDWHLGKSLYTLKRYDEQRQFLRWLCETITQEQIDLLLIAGDIFDTSSPSNTASKLYYEFLFEASAAGLSHIVIIAGNHDSPTFLDAPQALLEQMQVHVIGSASADPAEEVLELRDDQAELLCIVAAVPYLRDRDIRSAQAGESIEDKDRKLIEGISAHYQAAADRVRELQQNPGYEVPVLCMGHLFAAGAVISEDNQVRELYVGSLAHVAADIFGDVFDYVALGHLHSHQLVSGREHIRYSGSPLQLGFGEWRSSKYVLIISLEEEQRSISRLEVPAFRRLRRFEGPLEQLCRDLEGLGEQSETITAELICNSDESPSEIRQRIADAAEGSPVNILRIRHDTIDPELLTMHPESAASLDEMDPLAVFTSCLDDHLVSDEERPLLMSAYHEILRQISEEDTSGEN